MENNNNGNNRMTREDEHVLQQELAEKVANMVLQGKSRDEIREELNNNNNHVFVKEMTRENLTPAQRKQLQEDAERLMAIGHPVLPESDKPLGYSGIGDKHVAPAPEEVKNALFQ